MLSISWIISFTSFSVLSNFPVCRQLWELQNNPKCSSSHFSILILSSAKTRSDPMLHHEHLVFAGDFPRWLRYPWRFMVCREGHTKSGCRFSHLPYVLLGENRSKSNSFLTPPFWLHSSRLRNFLLILNFRSSAFQGRKDCWFPELLRNQFCLHLFQLLSLRNWKWCFCHFKWITTLVEWN